MLRSTIGSRKESLDTPALCIDLDAMEANIRFMAEWMQSRGKQWRPHQKCHKTPAIAHAQLAAGAIGVTCAKVSDAEVMAASGVRDILIANMVAGEQKCERLAALCRWADPVVACDHFAQVEPIAAACRKIGTTCRMIVEVNIGLDRVGTRPGADTVELAQAIDRMEGVQLVGIMGYEGHLLTITDPNEKRTAITEAMEVLHHCRQMLLAKGLCCDIVSAGGTGSFQITPDCISITEIQAGGGIFADSFYLEKCQITGLTPALTVLATVVSRPTLDRAVLDSGRKTVNPDIYPPKIKGYPDAQVTKLSAEHCQLQLGPQSRDLKIGDKVELFVGYSDMTTILHDVFHGFRGDRLETIWPILGRGKLQ